MREVAKRTFRFADYAIIGRAGLACPVEVADWNGLAPDARHPDGFTHPRDERVGICQMEEGPKPISI